MEKIGLAYKLAWAQASICFMALILHCVMHMRLRAANTGLTSEWALQSLRRIRQVLGLRK